MSNNEVVKKIEAEKTLPVYQQGTQNFHARNDRDAMYQIAAFICLAEKMEASSTQQSQDARVLEIQQNSGAVLSKMDKAGNPVMLCTAEYLQPLVKLIKKHDVSIVNKLNKLIEGINEIQVPEKTLKPKK